MARPEGRPRKPPAQVLDSKAHHDAEPEEQRDEPPENWALKTESEAFRDAAKLYPLIRQAFQNKEEQADRIAEYWSIFNATLDENQQYQGNQFCYIPAVRDAILARTKRAVRQLFPANHKHVDGLSSDSGEPWTQLALLEYYIRTLNLKSIIRTDLIAGDVTGQWNLHVDWFKSKRRITKVVTRNSPVMQIEGENVSDLELEDPDSKYDETEDDEVIEEGPVVEDFATEDFVVVPPTVEDLQKCKVCALRLRLSPDRIRELEDEGVFQLPEGTDIDKFTHQTQKDYGRKSAPKRATSDAGVKLSGTDRHAEIFYAYSKLNFGTEKQPDVRLGIIYYAGEHEIIGIIKAPYWNGKIPIISKPVDRLYGTFWGRSKIEPVKFLQWQCTDFASMAQDSAMYSILPIYAVDPQRVPQWANLTYGLAAMWPSPPDAIKPLPPPQMWKDGYAVVDTLKRQIWESMDVNEMMMGRMPQGRKNNALMGQMQQEQSTNLMDHVSRYEEEVLNPLMEMIFEFDQQFRTSELMIEQRGEIGVKAKIESIPPQQWGKKFYFRWLGSESMQNMQRLQTQIGWVNVLKGIPPQMLGGKTLDLSPMAEMGTENMFGPEMAPRILVDKRNQFTIDPELENEMLLNGFTVEVHQADDDNMHLASHMLIANRSQDPQGLFKMHMMAHMQQLKTKREMQMAQEQPKGLPGAPGGAGPGVAGTPRPGALPAPPRGGQGPPGAVQQDSMVGAPGRG